MHSLPCTEMAGVDALETELPSELHLSVRLKLARSFWEQKLLLSALALSGPAIHALCTEWDFIFSLMTLPADSRVIIYFISLYPTSFIIAAAFPTDASTRAGANFTVVPVVLGSALRCFGIVLDFYHTVYTRWDTVESTTFTIIYLITSAVILSIWLFALRQGLKRRFSWTLGRRTHLMEGTALLLCAVSLRATGASTTFPPGRMSFSAAIARGSLAVMLGGVVLAPRSRRAMAEMASRFRWNRVTLSLDDLAVAARDHALVERPMACSSDCSSDAETSTVSSVSRAFSHHTAKIVEGTRTRDGTQSESQTIRLRAGAAPRSMDG